MADHKAQNSQAGKQNNQTNGRDAAGSLEGRKQGHQ